MNLQTEQEYKIQNLDQLSTLDILRGINEADQSVATCVAAQLSSIQKVVDIAVQCIQQGGRIIYIGAGTSGRLGVLDSSECPPTFGVHPDVVQGVIAGGDGALRYSIEDAEDDVEAGWRTLLQLDVSKKDFIIGISASGHTPYVVAVLQHAAKNSILTGCIVCNEGSPVQCLSTYPIVVPTGPEVVTGSTRMKAGTAQKMVLNMVSTTVMIRLGKIKGNKMVDMQLKNQKLRDRAIRMLMNEVDCTLEEATYLINTYQSVRKSIAYYHNQLNSVYEQK